MKTQNILLVVCIIISMSTICWNRYVSSTKIAFVNYQAITLSQISKANDNSFVKIQELPVEKFNQLDRYDMIFVNGMGLHITDEQRQLLVKAAEKGSPVLTTGATNPQNQISSVDSIDHEYLRQYLIGGHSNYRNLLKYVRRFIDRKTLFADIPGDPQLSVSSLIYYPTDNDNINFNSVNEYENWLKKNDKWDDNATHIILTGQMGVPDDLIAKLEKSGHIVYPVNIIQQFITQGHADSITASVIINLAHGRMGDQVVNFLEKYNIPLFSPVNVNRNYNDWMNDKIGMNGGFLSQSVVTPEIDGAILPYSLFAHFDSKNGLPYVAAIPDRLETFVQTVNNYIALKNKPNKDKRIAIFYFKGPGQNALIAEGLDVSHSLFNLLRRLEKEGYNVGKLPDSSLAFEKIINDNGKIFNQYAIGAMNEFVKNNSPEIISAELYEKWCAASFSDKMRNDIDIVDDKFPGHGLSDENGNIAVARIQFGNVVLIPQTPAGWGYDDFKIVHGTDAAPPHNYVAAYLWARLGFEADALLHFGAHGSLEFTPRKQVALGSEDWSDRLIGSTPHFYIYSTSNVGEAMIAKRRSYAGIINHLTPPFMESSVRNIYKNLEEALSSYNKIAADDSADSEALASASISVKKYAVALGIHRELRLDSIMAQPYSTEDISRIENFAEELVNEKITGALYVLGEPYISDHIRSTVLAMTVDPIAFSLNKLHGGNLKKLRSDARTIVERLMQNDGYVTDKDICNIAGISQIELDSARKISMAVEGSKDMLSRMMVMGAMIPSMSSREPLKISDRKTPTHKHRILPGMSPENALEIARKMGADENAIKKMQAAMKRMGSNSGIPGNSTGGFSGGEISNTVNKLDDKETEFAITVIEIERAIRNVGNYMNALNQSPSQELTAVINALNGCYITPTSGGDPVLNPNILPTGRNMYAINAEETPSASAWEKGKALADKTISLYRKAHNDSLPQKVSYTLWSSEFIETGGATIAQILYMLGVEPVRDPFGRVTDLRLIPSEELKRPRIDIVVQTSGQLRDIAASRLFLISKAVKMAAQSSNDFYTNYVSEGVFESEKFLVDKGVPPNEARKLSTSRVFGGVNGNYGTGITSMVESGDKWETNSEIAETYIANMGASYDNEDDWEKFCDFAFEAALTRTDAVVQPRQSNTWGALSLDHVYEFMGGMNLAVRNITGKEPDAYMSDYRNRNNTRMQDLKEAIGVESRTTILNPAYLKEKMKGGSGDASALADIVRNTYGWNVMKPDAIDNELWDDIYDTFISDCNNLNIKDYFSQKSPAALQEITAVMLETARKGMWNATPDKIAEIAKLHTEMIEKYGAACSGFVCDNAKLRDFIKSNIPEQNRTQFDAAVSAVRNEQITSDNNRMRLKREEINKNTTVSNHIDGIIVSGFVVALFIVVAILLRRKRNYRT